MKQVEKQSKVSVTIGAAVIVDDSLDQLRQLLPQLSKLDQVVIGWNGKDPEVKLYLDRLTRKRHSKFEYFQFDWRPSAIKSWTDQEPENIKRYDIDDWGFSYARNLTFQRLSTTHAIWVDVDDKIGFMRGRKEVIVTPEQVYAGFKKVASEAPEDVDVWFCEYVYSRDAYNNPNVVLSRERMVKNPREWRWVYPIHEVLVGSNEPKHAIIKDIQFIHYPPQKEDTSLDRNLRMLHEWHDQLLALGDRYKHDLGRCRQYIGDTHWAEGTPAGYREAIKWLMMFIREHPSSLDIEKWKAWCFIAKCQIELNNFEAARAAALAAIDVEPGLSDGYILLAQVKLVTDQDPLDILLLIEQSARVDEPPVQIITNPLDYSYTPFCITSKCKYLLGQYEEALKWAMKAQEIAPDDERAEELRLDAATKVREQNAVEAAKALYRLYLDYDENEKADKLYAVLPYTAQRSPEIVEAATIARNRIRHMIDRDAYVNLYQENTHWKPCPEDWIDAGIVPGEARMNYILGRLKQALPNGGRILDVGCSDGFHSMMYAKAGYEVVGVDLDPRAVEIANERAHKRGLSAQFIRGFFEEMNPEKTLDPFDGQPWYHHFDAVICSEVIEHVQNPQFLMGCLIDCAKDEAPVIITTPDEAFDKGDTPEGGGMYEEDKELAGHVRVYTQEAFEALLKSDPEIDVVESRFLPYEEAYRENQGWQVGEVRRQAHKDGPIVRIYCGPSANFSAGSLEINKEPIAGSEIAVICMAKELARLGCQVVVYSGVNGVYDGVFYRTLDHYSSDHYSDIFISWRLPTVFEHVRPNAKKTVLWTHDLFYMIQMPGLPRDALPDEWVDRIDTVFALSNFHKGILEDRHPNFKGKLVVTRNGLDPALYNKDIKKVPHRYFYSSDWIRGIEELLAVWPDIKASIPDAELHIAYSYDLIRSLYKLMGDAKRLRELDQIYTMIQGMSGVTYHDRLGKTELADLQLSCEAWLYPFQPSDPNGGFLETYCMTALEAQAAGCRVISRYNGALSETIKYGIEWTADTDIVDLLNNYITSDTSLQEARDWALLQSWESLAKDWLKQLAPVEALSG